MKNLKEIIAQASLWGSTPKLEIKTPKTVLKKFLIELYKQYLDIEHSIDEDEKEYPDPPEFNFEVISNTIRSNFPQLGFYQSVMDPFDLEKPDNCLEDANDDLSEIIKDMMEVQWRFDHTSEQDALWYFEFIVRNNSEQHLVNLLKNLKDSEASI